MKWNEKLFTVFSEAGVDLAPIENLIKLPLIRDEVFLPDYAQFGYMSIEPEVSTWDGGGAAISMPITSISANRTLSIAYVLNPSNGRILNGSFTDLIHILSAENAWGNTIYIDILAQKFFHTHLLEAYNNTSTYPGDFLHRCKACLEQIKVNYDTFARDIIAGKDWNAHAYRDRDDF